MFLKKLGCDFCYVIATKKVKNNNKWVTVKKRVMIFSPTTLTHSNAVKRHQKFKFPIDEFFLIKTLCSRQKKHRTVFEISFFSFFCFLRCDYCFWKICPWQLTLLLLKKWQVGRKNILFYIMLLLSLQLRKQKKAGQDFVFARSCSLTVQLQKKV